MPFCGKAASTCVMLHLKRSHHYATHSQNDGQAKIYCNMVGGPVVESCKTTNIIAKMAADNG